MRVQSSSIMKSLAHRDQEYSGISGRVGVVVGVLCIVGDTTKGIVLACQDGLFVQRP